MRRQDLNNPPTAVGGIPVPECVSLSGRRDLNHPPTAVGGILEGFADVRVVIDLGRAN
jgi:hypothetical protein